MPINKGPRFTTDDVYVNYPFENVMFRWDHRERKIYRKFYGKDEGSESVPHDNRLYTHALLWGDEISREQYEKGMNI
jgi:hypothetical protein